MAQISAAAVQSLRTKTGLPMMDCKRALEEADGDQEKAIEALRKAGAKTMEKRAGRATTFGRIALYTEFAGKKATMIDLRCESAPVATNEEFVRLAGDLAQQLATGPGAKTPEELLGQPSPSKPGQTLQHQFDDLNNRIREVFRLERIVRIDASCGGYAHHNGAVGVLLEVEGGNAELAKEVCMHVAAMRPVALKSDEVDPARVAKEREIAAEVARREGKPEKIIEKIVDGRLKAFFAECCLLEQPFVKDPSKSVAKYAEDGGMKIVRFVHWELPKE
ncbi:MAG: translation elongation factor Ts [Planctomycetota bacterium]